ncbi:hypothetical protein P4V86_03275 [Brevibacillus laterosporus]|uniref:hypothetical protein n=1 Tax=Brevibacillus laterosporus TaxID=1465 RepID=UPI0003623937|nr:hypothetical protein [Brevibacillus laterosporus]ATO48545.1 hypothetical protein BrL25_05110 [Brevibacillus laterosporus DSM 25]MED2002379.1 hypothetical protein [Brevibacillus laterosporus]
MTVMKWEQERREWVKSLKEGDKVAYYNTIQHGSERRYKILTVKKITSKGKIRLSDDTLFDEKGDYRSGTGWYRNFYRLEPVTKEIIDHIRRTKILYDLNNTKFDSLTLDKLEEIIKIIS